MTDLLQSCPATIRYFVAGGQWTAPPFAAFREVIGITLRGAPRCYGPIIGGGTFGVCDDNRRRVGDGKAAGGAAWCRGAHLCRIAGPRGPAVRRFRGERRLGAS